MKIVKCNNQNIMMVLKEIENVDDKVIRSNNVDAAFEKHVPQYEMNGEKVRIFVNHVMEEEHFIEWILVDYGNKQIVQHFLPGDNPTVEVDYADGMIAYSYCNKHSLWVRENITQ